MPVGCSPWTGRCGGSPQILRQSTISPQINSALALDLCCTLSGLKITRERERERETCTPAIKGRRERERKTFSPAMAQTVGVPTLFTISSLNIRVLIATPTYVSSFLLLYMCSQFHGVLHTVLYRLLSQHR